MTPGKGRASTTEISKSCDAGKLVTSENSLRAGIASIRCKLGNRVAQATPRCLGNNRYFGEELSETQNARRSSSSDNAWSVDKQNLVSGEVPKESPGVALAGPRPRAIAWPARPSYADTPFGECTHVPCTAPANPALTRPLGVRSGLFRGCDIAKLGQQTLPTASGATTSA
jgi:hypothetical protein